MLNPMLFSGLKEEVISLPLTPILYLCLGVLKAGIAGLPALREGKKILCQLFRKKWVYVIDSVGFVFIKQKPGGHLGFCFLCACMKNFRNTQMVHYKSMVVLVIKLRNQEKRFYIS